jgi:ABC-type amino acid transport system permease subunit
VAQGRKATVSYGGRIGNAIVSGFNGISNFFIGIIENWPVIVTLVVLFFFIRKRFKRKNK